MNDLTDRLRIAAAWFDTEDRPEETIMWIAADHIKKLEATLRAISTEWVDRDNADARMFQAWANEALAEKTDE